MIDTSEKLKIIFSHHCEYKPTFYIYHPHPNRHNTAKEVVDADRRAARDIAELQEAIDNLTEIRAALAARYNELATMPYTYTLELTRYAGWRGSNITYTVKITRVYEDKSTAEELRETFPGKERHKAIARYKELAKSHPGITCSMDIESHAGSGKSQEDTMKNQFSFEFTQQIGDNFTPAAKISQFARINGYKTDYRYFTQYIIIKGIAYTYHHYDITPISASREKVTIHLEEV